MKISELFENKTKKDVVKPPVARNYVAKNSQKSGAGAHEPKKYTRKEKHKSREDSK